ncbi:unnamed protein product [Linum tenue]|uniref:Uncharacterized protein n=1 Tax=Linum tenue TaxID=586396 RepID=A0AAV0HGS6_9ROSI|nr:unnamed protein product [Linum tenue]
MLANLHLISCNFSSQSFDLRPRSSSSRQTQSLHHPKLPRLLPKAGFNQPFLLKHNENFPIQRKGSIQICRSVLKSPDDPEKEQEGLKESKDVGARESRDWTSSILLFVFWGGILYYVFNLTPDQTPSRDMYFLLKLCNLKGDDGFRMNEFLVSLWYIMGLWPLAYSMLLLPTGRSSKSKIPVWPFLVLSCFGGAYALMPYFVLWNPPPPSVEESELKRWPLNVMDSKLTAVVLLAAGLGLFIRAGISIDDWGEFFQYFRESKFIHITSLDFSLLSLFAPFWVYNDMTARKCFIFGPTAIIIRTCSPFRARVDIQISSFASLHSNQFSTQL